MATPAQDFAKFYSQWESLLDDVLKRASREAGKRIADLPSGISSVQVSAMSRRIAQAAVSAAYADVDRMLRTGIIEAAVKGGGLSADEMAMFAEMGLSDETMDALADSLRYQASAGFEAAARRVSGQTNIPLSSQVYRTTALSKGMVDKAINTALAQGMSAAQLAKLVRDMIDPSVAGGVSYAAKRLARTELNNAFHESAKARLRSAPWVEAVKWHLSGSHSTPDICNEYAQNDAEGLGEGIWPPGKVPAKPHPQCLCYVSAVLPTDKQFVDRLLTGKYDDHLDDVMRKAGYDDNFIAKSRFIKQASKNAGSEIRRTPGKGRPPFSEEKWLSKKSPQYVVNDLKAKARVLGDDEAEVVRQYVEDGLFMPLNESLRGKQLSEMAQRLSSVDLDDPDVQAWIRGYVNEMNGIIDESRSISEMTVYRGLNAADLGDFKVGSVIEDRGFMSTTTDSNLAWQWERDTLRIKVKSNTPALNVEGVPGVTLRQSEILFKTGTRIKVTGIQVMPDGTRLIDAVML